MYSIDRETASKELNISTRTLDRYIKSGKIRSKKIWKKIFLNIQDIEIIKKWWIQEDYEIIPSLNNKKSSASLKVFNNEDSKSYKELFEETSRILEKKDDLIKDLSYKVGKLEMELKNSISLLEYKKATFLLETTNVKSEDEKKDLTQSIDILKEKVRSQEFLNIILIIVFALTLIIVFLIWFTSL